MTHLYKRKTKGSNEILRGEKLVKNFFLCQSFGKKAVIVEIVFLLS